MRTSKHTRRAGTAANSSAVSDFVDDFATVLSQDEPVVQEAAQHRVGTRPVDQETHARKPQSASAPANRLRRVMPNPTRRPPANSAIRRSLLSDPFCQRLQPKTVQ